MKHFALIISFLFVASVMAVMVVAILETNQAVNAEIQKNSNGIPFGH